MRRESGVRKRAIRGVMVAEDEEMALTWVGLGSEGGFRSIV
jgi:hypothetical protein